MKISPREALALNFSEYCRILLRVQEECKDTLLPSEKEYFQEHSRKILATGIGYSPPAGVGFGDKVYLRLKPGTDLANAELNLDAIHHNLDEQSLAGMVNGLGHAVQALMNYYNPEPNVCVLKPHADNPNYRHLTHEWIHWYKLRHPDQVSLRQIVIIGGERIHEMMIRDGTSPLRPGNKLKVSVNIEDAIWDGNDVPVGLWYTSTQEF